MKYALLIYYDPATLPQFDEEEQRAVTAEYYAIADEPSCLAGGHLQPVESATTVRVAGGEVLTTDGPFAETKEVFAGYFLFELDNLDQALEIAGRVPAARMGGSVEVRALVEEQPRVSG